MDPTSCTATVDRIEDEDVVEVGEHNVAMLTPGIFNGAKRMVGNLWEALFPAVLAQTWVSRRAYNDIITCGIIGCSRHGSLPSTV
jgi:hypothetical protein